MTIDQAIKQLAELERGVDRKEYLDLYNAIQLGIDALGFLRDNYNDEFLRIHFRLPRGTETKK